MSNPTAPLPRNEVRPIPGTDVVAYRYQIIGTTLWVYEAWEPTDGAPGAGFAHGTIRSPLDFAEATGRETWWGQVATRRLPADLDALPAWSDERFTAVRAYQAALGAEARAYIIRAFPEAAEGRDAGSGSIELVVRQPVSVPLAARREV